MANNLYEKNTASNPTCSVCKAPLVLKAKYLNKIDRDTDKSFRLNHHKIVASPKRLKSYGFIYWRHDERYLDDDGNEVFSLETHVSLSLKDK